MVGGSRESPGLRGKALAMTGVLVAVKPMRMVHPPKRMSARREKKAHDRTQGSWLLLQWPSGFHHTEAVTQTTVCSLPHCITLPSPSPFFTASSCFTLRIATKCTTYRIRLHAAYVPFKTRIRPAHCSQCTECSRSYARLLSGDFSPPSSHR